MSSVVIRHKETGEFVAEVNVHVAGQNYTPSELQQYAQAWRIAVDDRIVEADANKDDFTFEVVPVTVRDAFS
jgi:hypothetical protein